MSKFAERLKQLREDRKLLAKDFAKDMNVEPATITNWEKGNRFPKDDVLVQIADYFNCSIDYLLGRTDFKDAVVVESKLNDQTIEIEIDKDYSEKLTPADIENIIKQLDAAGLNVKKLIENAKNK